MPALRSTWFVSLLALCALGTAFVVAGSRGAAIESPTPRGSVPPMTTTFAQIPEPVRTAPAIRDYSADPAACRGSKSSCTGAPGAFYAYPAPPAGSSGYDAEELTIGPRFWQKGTSAERSDQSQIYWAYQDRVDGHTFYFGLQPNDTSLSPHDVLHPAAIFSMFGKHTSSDPAEKACFASADGGSGTSCRIPYTFAAKGTYDFTILLVSQTADARTWEGRVHDESAAAGTFTKIADITVAGTGGIDGAGNETNFDEYIAGWCPQHSLSRVLFFSPVPYYEGTAYPGHTTKADLGAFAGCGNVAFHSDDRSFTYIDEGRPR